MKNKLILISVFITCVAFSCKKNNDVNQIEQENKRYEDAISIIAGKKYIWDSYYSVDAANVKADLISTFACSTKDTIKFGSIPIVSRMNDGTNRISDVAYEQYYYTHANSCWVNSQFNSSKNPSTFTYITMDDGDFEMPFPINQLNLINYSGITNSLEIGSIEDTRFVLYYDGNDGKRYYIEYRRL